MDYQIEFVDTPVGRQRYEQCVQAIRTRAGAAGGDKDAPSFEDQKKEGRLLRKLRAIGKPKDWIAEVEKQLDNMPDGPQRLQLEKVLAKMQKGDDPRVAEPEEGMPETRDYVLREGGGVATLEHDEKELLVKRLKDNKWFPDWAEFGVDLVEYITDVKGIEANPKVADSSQTGAGNAKPRRVEKSA